MEKKVVIKVLVDATHDFVAGIVGSPAAQAAVPAMVDFIDPADEIEKVKAALDAAGIEYEEIEGVLYILTHDDHGADYTKCAEAGKYSFIHGEPGTPGFELYKDIKAVFDANANNPKFTNIAKEANMPYGCELDFKKAMKKAGVPNDYLTGKNVVFIVGGLVSDICGMQTALWLYTAFPWSKVVYDAKVGCGLTPELHEKACDIMESWTIKVINR